MSTANRGSVSFHVNGFFHVESFLGSITLAYNRIFFISPLNSAKILLRPVANALESSSVVFVTTDWLNGWLVTCMNKLP